MHKAWIEQTGVMHVHSRYSDGGADVPRLLSAARDAALDFMVLTDHDTLSARREGWEGERQGIHVLVGAEITPRRKPHLLALRVRSCAGLAVPPTAEAIEAVRAQGGFVIIAHPQGKVKRWLGIEQRALLRWEHPAVRGIELWAYTHDWIDSVRWWTFGRAHTLLHRPETVVRGPEPDVLARWDRQGRARRLAGWSGLDTHAKRVPFAGAVVFPYAAMFRRLRNHLFIRPGLSGAEKTAALWGALAEGRGFVAHDILRDSRGARCEAIWPGGDAMMPGEERPFAIGGAMRLALPCPADIRWLCDGRERLRVHGRELTGHPAGPGVYRFEARVDGRPWLYTNAFYLRPAAAAAS